MVGRGQERELWQDDRRDEDEQMSATTATSRWRRTAAPLLRSNAGRQFGAPRALHRSCRRRSLTSGVELTSALQNDGQVDRSQTAWASGSARRRTRAAAFQRLKSVPAVHPSSERLARSQARTSRAQAGRPDGRQPNQGSEAEQDRAFECQDLGGPAKKPGGGRRGVCSRAIRRRPTGRAGWERGNAFRGVWP